MSDEPKRRETAEGKEERRREIEGLIESMNRTAPKAAGVSELPVKTLKKLKLEHPDFWKSSHDLPGSWTQREP
jgi:hypothetical protein